MKKILAAALLLACALSGAACSRSEKKPEVTVAPTATPPPSLPSDAQKLQQAQMKAAAAHAQEHAASPTPTPASP